MYIDDISRIDYRVSNCCHLVDIVIWFVICPSLLICDHVVGYEPYDTPFYGRNLALAIFICFFTLIVFIVVVNFSGFLFGQGSRPVTVLGRVNPTRTAQIWDHFRDWLFDWMMRTVQIDNFHFNVGSWTSSELASYTVNQKKRANSIPTITPVFLGWFL